MSQVTCADGQTSAAHSVVCSALERTCCSAVLPAEVAGTAGPALPEASSPGCFIPQPQAHRSGRPLLCMCHGSEKSGNDSRMTHFFQL